MKQQDYRNQFENQVKDLITQYAETHSHAPDVTIQLGKGAPAALEQEDTKKKKRIDDAWEDLGSTLYDMGNDEPGW